tara:strand:- start:426 stop:713 length:288 start_codon:yes stop_codon:yes gene_type:complete
MKIRIYQAYIIIETSAAITHIIIILFLELYRHISLEYPQQYIAGESKAQNVTNVISSEKQRARASPASQPTRRAREAPKRSTEFSMIRSFMSFII